MREIKIDFTGLDCFDSVFAGYTGEHNATELLLVVSEEMINKSDYQVVVIQSGTKIFKSESISDDVNMSCYRSGNTIHIKLDKKFTQYTGLVIQVEFYKNNKSGEVVLIAKTPVAPNVFLKPSPNYNNELIPEEDSSAKIPESVVRLVDTLPETPEIGTVVALVSDDKTKVNGFYIAVGKTDEGTVWNLYVTSGGSFELPDGSVTESKLADNSIGTGKYKLNSIGGSHIASRMIESRHLDFDAVQTYAIKNGAVTPEKLDREYLTEHQSLEGYATEEEIPTKLSELDEDENHRLVTDEEKESWNNKSDFSGNYNDLEDTPCYDFSKYDDIDVTYTGNDVLAEVVSNGSFWNKYVDSYIKVCDLPSDYLSVANEITKLISYTGSERSTDSGGISLHIHEDKKLACIQAFTSSGKYDLLLVENADTLFETVAATVRFPESGIYVFASLFGDSIKTIISKIVFKENIKYLDPKLIEDGTVTDSKLAKKYATEEYIDEAMSFEEIELPEGFENYTNVIHLSEPLQRDWSKVKIWSADDGIVGPDSGNIHDFDISQITKTNYVTIGNIPNKIDLTPLEGKSVASYIIFYDENYNSMLCITFMKTDSTFMLGLNLDHSDTNMYYLCEGGSPLSHENFVAPSEGWYVIDYSDDTIVNATEKDLSILSRTYETARILDWASLNIDQMSEMGVDEISNETLIDLLLKDMMTVYYPPGYYLTDKAEEYATKEDIVEINERLDTLVPKTWADVQQIVRNGQAPQVFNIGDQLICSKNGVAHVWDIIGFDVDAPINSNYTHSMTLQLNTAFEGRAFDDDSNDYSVSSVREYLNGDYLSGFDEDFLSVIGGIRKSDLLYNTDAESTDDDIYPESEIFFLLSADEVSTNPYELYSSAENDPTIRIKTAGSTALCHWWLRSSNYTEASTAADKVGTDGNISAGTITRASYYLAPACVIY